MASELTKVHRECLLTSWKYGTCLTHRERTAIAAALQTIDSLTSQLAARASEVERLKERVTQLEKATSSHLFAADKMLDRHPNAYFSAGQIRELRAALAQQEPPK